MRRLALLVAGGALWLFLAAFPVSADGGPHQLAVNSGTAGLSGDCAACHRAHTAKAADLLKEDMPGLCLSCHDGTGATTDVVDGYQYTPNGAGNPTATVLGGLRGGGFSYALIDSANAARISTGGVQAITIGGAPTGGTFTLTFSGQTTGPITYSTTTATTATNITTALVALSNIGTSTTYTGSTAAANMSSSTANNASAAYSATTGTYNVSFQNGMRLAVQPLMTANAAGLTGGASPTVTVADTTMTQVRSTAAVPALAATAKVATTSSHEGLGTVWGNGAVGTVGATGVVLDCAKCHNPHGNGQYRILNTTPGEDWSAAAGVVNWTAPVNAVEVVDATPATLTAGQVRNYTVKAGNLTTDVAAGGSGDYLRYHYDVSGAANWTNFYLKADQMNTGWTGLTPTNKAANGGVAPANTTGLMTAWCVTCHTRYSGLPDAAGSPSSLSNTSGGDTTFMFKHGTARIGCEQCHVSHGTDAAMTAQFSAAVTLPGGTAPEDSALLKVDNRGTCNICHEPTHTVVPGTTAGTPAAKAKIPVNLTDKY